MTTRDLKPRWLTLPGGRQIYQDVAPATDGPTVICESGMGLSRSIWALLAQHLPENYGIITYDRSGLGRSPATVGPRTLDALAQDLNTIITLNAPAGPIILVGHSWGGPIVRKVAPTLGARLSRMVLLDPTDEREEVPENQDSAELPPLLGSAARLAAQAGMYWLHAQWLARHLPADAAAAFVAESSTPDHASAQLRELASYTADLAELTANPPPAVDVPVVIVSGGGTWPTNRYRQRLIEAHLASAEAYSRGEHVLLERCDHYPMLTHVSDVQDAVCGKE